MLRSGCPRNESWTVSLKAEPLLRRTVGEAHPYLELDKDRLPVVGEFLNPDERDAHMLNFFKL
jgi:hypothetical protein